MAMNRAVDLGRAFWNTVRRGGDPTHRSTTDAMLAADVAHALRQLDAIRDECRALVTRRAALSAGAAVVPLPGLDVGTDIAILVKLLPRISERFGLDASQVQALDADTKRIVMMAVSAVGSHVIGRLVTREVVVRLLMKMGVRVTTKGIVRYVPLVGQALSASLSFGAMKLLGNRHIDECHEVARRALFETVSRDASIARLPPRDDGR